MFVEFLICEGTDEENSPFEVPNFSFCWTKAKIEQKNELIAATKENIAKQADLLKHKSAE